MRAGTLARMTTTTAIGNQKGGVGKTTVTVCLASELARLGRRVLVVDMDQQANASMILGAERDVTVADVLTPGGVELEAALTASAWDGIDVLPGSPTVQSLEKDPDPLVALRLRRAMVGSAAVLEKYDDVLVDLPPALGVAALSGLVAADRVAIVAVPEALSSAGMSRFLTAVNEVKEALRPELRLHGVIVNKYHRSFNEDQYRVKELRQYVGDIVLDPYIPSRQAAVEVASEGLPLHQLKSEGARELSRLFARHARLLAGTEVK